MLMRAKLIKEINTCNEAGVQIISSPNILLDIKIYLIQQLNAKGKCLNLG